MVEEPQSQAEGAPTSSSQPDSPSVPAQDGQSEVGRACVREVGNTRRGEREVATLWVRSSCRDNAGCEIHPILSSGCVR